MTSSSSFTIAAAAEMTTFSPTPILLSLRGILFDMDGTLIDSTNAVVKFWTKLGAELGVDPKTILASSHGRRTVEVLQIYDPSKANMEYVKSIEGQIPEIYGHDATEIPGARSILDAIGHDSYPWTIVTSGTRPLVTRWLSVLSLPEPAHIVTAEDVVNGKPDPACYKLGASKLGLAAHAQDVLVIEDAPAGIRAGKAAGCKVLALLTSHTLEQVVSAGPDWVVRDLRSVRLVPGLKDGTFTLEIRDTLVRS